MEIDRSIYNIQRYLDYQINLKELYRSLEYFILPWILLLKIFDVQKLALSLYWGFILFYFFLNAILKVNLFSIQCKIFKWRYKIVKIELNKKYRF